MVCCTSKGPRADCYITSMPVSQAAAAAERGAAWLLQHLEPDGSLRGGPSLAAYYKGPCALAWSGHRAEAVRILAFVRAKFALPDGDLDGAGVPWLPTFRIYPHAWLAVGALELGDYDFALALTHWIERSYNPKSGGFLAREDGAEEIMTTSMAGLACLRAGRTEIASRVAVWLARVFAAQPDLTRGLDHVWMHGLGLIEGDGSVMYRVDASKPRQWYFQYGLSAAFLADYARVSGDMEALDLARQYLRASRHCHSDVYQTPQSGKIGWGAAWVWDQTRDPEELALVDAVVEGLCALQCGDGSWNPDGVYEAKPEGPAESRFDVTAEFVALLAQMKRANDV
jgi:hypothetical protein